MLLLGLAATGARRASAEPPAADGVAALPAWAYPGDLVQRHEDWPAGQPLRVPDSARRYLPSDLGDLYQVADWHPEDHPPMPPIVARGRRAVVYACGYCHLADGSGRPENASLAGLPADYIVRQLQDMKAGRRTTSVPHRLPPELMRTLAAQLTDAEMTAAADYFAGLPRRASLDVVESASVPVTRESGWSLAVDATAGEEALGERIIEVAEDRLRFEQRDSRVRYRVYVPVGSIARGEQLALHGDGARVPACTSCHGTTLVGLAGRSPSYLTRQLYDFRTGARRGEAAAAMIGVARGLGEAEYVWLAAYFASLH